MPQSIVSKKQPFRGDRQLYGADPLVIAVAKAGGPHWIVVSDEHPGSSDNRKIPFVCNHGKVDCITFQGMMLAEGWQFL
jgi:hypothetical protein